MDIDAIIQAGIAKFKQKIAAFCEERSLDRLTPELAQEMSRGIKGAISAAEREIHLHPPSGGATIPRR